MVTIELSALDALALSEVLTDVKEIVFGTSKAWTEKYREVIESVLNQLKGAE